MPRSSVTNSDLVDVQLRTVYESMSQAIPPKFKKDRLLSLGEILSVENVKAPYQVSNRPVIQSDARVPSTLKHTPVSIHEESKAVDAGNQLNSLLTQGSVLADSPELPVATTLGSLAVMGLRQGKPQLVRQAIVGVGGTGLSSKFELKAQELQSYRGKDGRFMSPECADILAAVFTGVELEIGSVGVEFSNRVETVENNLTNKKSVSTIGSWLDKPLKNRSQIVVGVGEARSRNTAGFSFSKARIPLNQKLIIPKAHVEYIANGHISGNFLEQVQFLWDATFGSMVDGWIDWAQEKCSALVSWFSTFSQNLWSNIGELFTSIVSFFESAFDLGALFSGDFQGWFANLAASAQQSIVELWVTVSEAAIGIWDLTTAMVPMVEELWVAVQGCVSTPWTCIQDLVAVLVNSIIDTLMDLFVKFMKAALQAIVALLGDLGRLLGGNMSKFDNQVKSWIREEFAGTPFKDMALGIWKAVWDSIKFAIACLCNKSCIQTVGGAFKDTNNIVTKTIGWIFWLLGPLMQGDPIPGGLSLEGFPGTDGRYYSFCRWYLQAGEGLMPAPKLTETWKKLVGDLLGNTSKYYCDYNTCGPGARYSKYMVDDVAKRYMMDEYGAAAPPGLRGSDSKFGRGPYTEIWPEHNALWYAKRPEEALKAQQSFGVEASGVDFEGVDLAELGDTEAGYGTDLNPWPGWIGWRARKLADTMMKNWCGKSDGYHIWLKTHGNSSADPSPGNYPYAGCKTPDGSATDGQCWHPAHWYSMFTKAPLYRHMDEECFNLNAPDYYELAKNVSIWNWGSPDFSEWDRDNMRAGSQNLLTGFEYTKQCSDSVSQWHMPELAGEPSIWDMGYPTWQGGGGYGYTKHLSQNTTMYKYFAYYMDWLEANTDKPVELPGIAVHEMTELAGTDPSGDKTFGQLPQISLSDSRKTIPGRSYSMEQILSKEVSYAGKTSVSAKTIPDRSYSMEQILSKEVSYAGKTSVSAKSIGSLGAVRDTDFSMASTYRPVGYQTAHIRYQNVWKTLSPGERVSWLKDVPGDNNPVVYNPAGPPAAPPVQPYPDACLSVDMQTMAYGSGSWTTSGNSSSQITGAVNSTIYEAPLEASHTVYQAKYGTPGKVNRGGTGKSYAEMSTTSDSGLANQLLSMEVWGSTPMTRKRFWAGEMMAYFTSTGETEYTYLAVPEVQDAMEQVLGAMHSTGYKTDASPEMDYTPHDPTVSTDAVDTEDGVADTDTDTGIQGPETKKSKLPWIIGVGSLLTAGAWYIITKDDKESP